MAELTIRDIPQEELDALTVYRPRSDSKQALIGGRAGSRRVGAVHARRIADETW